jgi:hypothetical protein
LLLAAEIWSRILPPAGAKVNTVLFCVTEGKTMSIDNVIREIEIEIERLTRVLALLGRKKGTWRKKMTATARKKISAAQKKRWAKVKARKK